MPAARRPSAPAAPPRAPAAPAPPPSAPPRRPRGGARDPPAPPRAAAPPPRRLAACRQRPARPPPRPARRRMRRIISFRTVAHLVEGKPIESVLDCRIEEFLSRKVVCFSNEMLDRLYIDVLKEQGNYRLRMLSSCRIRDLILRGLFIIDYEWVI